MSLETFENNYQNADVQSAFNRITGLSIKENKAAYIAFVGAISTDRNLNVLKALNHSIKNLAQKLDDK